MMPFRELSAPARLAIAQYMAVDGEAWNLPHELHPYATSAAKIKREFRSMLPWLTKKYGSERFGYVEIPMDVLTEAVMDDELMKTDMPNMQTFDQYHKWYAAKGRMPSHPTTDLWPVILSSDYEEETLQDGWHRLHDYYRKGVEDVPAVYYP